MDLEAVGRSGRLVFVDGLSGLFTGAAPPAVKGGRTLRGAELPDIRRELEAAISDVQGADGKTVLVIDQADLLLAASGEDVTGLALRSLLLDVQEVCPVPFLSPDSTMPSFVPVHV